MNIKFLCGLVLVLVGVWGVPSPMLQAVEPPVDQALRIPGMEEPELKQLPGTVNCFDYYTFGSVNVDVGSEFNHVLPGVPLSLKGTITNENNYPIVDGAVYVKVFRKQPDPLNAHSNGHYLVDQFWAKEQIVLDAKASQEIAFEWKIPSYAAAGEYQLATYVISANKFNLSGLSFTDDVTGGIYEFTVRDTGNQLVEFKKNEVTINNTPHRFAAFAPQFTKDEEVTIKTIVSNQTKEDELIPIHWMLYSWDGLEEKNLITTKKETIDIGAGKDKEITYTVTDTKHSVYFLVAQVNYKGTKSILDIHFVRAGVDRLRINFPAITSFPLKKDQQSTLFSCLHNAGIAHYVKDNKLVLSLVDGSGNTIHSYTYSGDVSGEMMGVISDFIPKDNYNAFTLKAALYHDNQVVDSAEMQYDCRKINPSKCIKEADMPFGSTSFDANRESRFLFIMIPVVVFVVLLVAFIMRKKRQSFSVLLALMVGAGTLLTITLPAEAKETSYTWQYSGNLQYASNRWNRYPEGTFMWMKGLGSPNMTVKYHANIINRDTGLEILDSSTIPVGTNLSFVVDQFDDTDISWFGTGYTSDSPFGRWMTMDTYPPADVTCDEWDYVGTYKASGTSLRLPVYIPFYVKKPDSVVISHSGSTAGLTCNESGSECQVASAGTITSSIVFSETWAQFLYRYYDERNMCGMLDTVCYPCAGYTECGYECASEFYCDSRCTGDDYCNMDSEICFNIEERDCLPGCYESKPNGGDVPMRKASDKQTYTAAIPSQTISFTLYAQPPTQCPHGCHRQLPLDMV